MEIKFYEKIGVLKWKKFLLWVMAQILRKPEYRKGTNYYLSGLNIKSVKMFRIMILFNGSVHTFGIWKCILYINDSIFKNNIISFSTLNVIICLLINLYCVMLQRYNWLRIRRVLKKYKRKR